MRIRSTLNSEHDVSRLLFSSEKIEKVTCTGFYVDGAHVGSYCCSDLYLRRMLLHQRTNIVHSGFEMVE